MGLQLSPDVLALNAEALAGVKTARLAGAPRVAAKADPYKSNLERRFARELANTIFVPGEWKYEGITLRIAGGRYTPDFFGPLADGRGLAAVECKGWNQNLRADKTKFRAAVAEHKWLSFAWFTWDRRAGWGQQWYLGGGRVP